MKVSGQAAFMFCLEHECCVDQSKRAFAVFSSSLKFFFGTFYLNSNRRIWVFNGPCELRERKKEKERKKERKRERERERERACEWVSEWLSYGSIGPVPRWTSAVAVQANGPMTSSKERATSFSSTRTAIRAISARGAVLFLIFCCCFVVVF